MDYRRFGNKIVVRLDRGDEIRASLLELAEKENIALASVTGIGATNDVTLGLFDTRRKEYKERRYNDNDYEIASLTGNFTRKDGEPYLHLHVVVGNILGPKYGRLAAADDIHSGHLVSAVITAAAEIIIDVIDGEVGRKFSEEVGFNLMDF